MKNIALIGMPGAGKSTVGVILAKYLSLDFIDTDLLIQHQCRSDLQGIIDGEGFLALRKIEEEIIASLAVANTVIATGGSAVYSGRAMERLKKNGRLVYLKQSMDRLLRRIGDYSARGIAAPAGQTFGSLYAERTKLYKKYAELTIECGSKTCEEIAREIIRKVKRR